MSTLPPRVVDHGTPRHRGTGTYLGTFDLGVPVSRWYVALCVAALCLVGPANGQAQSREFMLRGFADIGSTRFTAEQSFMAVLGSPRGRILGGGVEVVLPHRIFANLRVSRFRDVGRRVFVFNNERFDLGIPTTITVTPIELTGGYRFPVGRRLVPYGGAGIGWHGYRETSRFAEAEENVHRRELGYHVVGGAEVRLMRWIGAAAEAQWTTVPDALGADPNGVSHDFGESDLGGVTVRVKVVVGW